MKLLYPLLSALGLYATGCRAQNNYNFGDGIIQVQHYFAPNLNLEHPDTANKLFTTYTYYVKRDKVLRAEDVILKEMNKSKSITQEENYTFKTALKANLIQYSYLMDFGHNKSYVYYSKKDTTLASSSTILEQKIDFFYRCLLLLTRKNNQIILKSLVTDSAQPDLGWGYGLSNNDTIYFQYSIKDQSIPSPLGNIFSSQQGQHMPYITLLWAPTPSSGADGKIFKGYSVFHISKIIPMNLPDSLFTLKSGTIVRENVPLIEMSHTY